jgi:hypothetical protein
MFALLIKAYLKRVWVLQTREPNARWDIAKMQRMDIARSIKIRFRKGNQMNL